MPEYQIGDVAYYVKRRGHIWSVEYGIVAETFLNTLALQLLEVADTTLINGIPKKEFETPSRWTKLPKGWNVETKLFEIHHAPMPDELKELSFKNKEDILKAYEEGYLVKVSDNDHSKIQEEINKDLGWRIIRSYYNVTHKPDLISLWYKDVYKTYNEAFEVVTKHELALKQQSEMSEYDWAVKDIDETLNRWAGIYGVSDEIKSKYRKWLLNLDDIENVETRIYSKCIQWKYFENKRWLNIEL